MATWPASLPQKAEKRGYSESAQEQTIRSNVGAGPPKVRRRFTAKYKNINFIMIMTTAQVATLETFFDTTLLGGSDIFDFNDPITQVTKSHRFKKRYSLTNIGGENYDVNIELEQLP